MTWRTSAILLTEGRSSRAGISNHLLSTPDCLSVVHCVELIFAAGINDLIVVVGREGGEVARALAGLPVTLVWNREAERTVSASLRAGLSVIAPAVDGILVSFCQHQLVAPNTLAALLRYQEEHHSAIVVPAHKGEKGGPILFPRRVLASIARHSTLRELIDRYEERVSLLQVLDEGILSEMQPWDDAHLSAI